MTVQELAELQHECAYRIVGFTGLNTETVDGYVGNRYKSTSFLPENIPLSVVFSTADHEWVDHEVEEVAVNCKEFSVGVGDVIKEVGTRAIYDIHSATPSFGIIKDYLSAKIQKANGSGIVAISDSLALQYDQARFSTSEQESLRGSIVRVSNLGIVRFFDETYPGPCVVREVYPLLKNE